MSYIKNKCGEVFKLGRVEIDVFTAFFMCLDLGMERCQIVLFKHELLYLTVMPPRKATENHY